MSVSHEGFPLSEQQEREISCFHRCTRNRFGTWLFGLLAFGTIALPTFLYGPIVLFLYWTGLVRHYNIRNFCDYWCAGWMRIMVYYFEAFLGIKTRTFGYTGQFKRRCLFLMNHRSHFDWMFFWSVVDRQGNLTYWKAITKDMLKKAPLIGQAMEYSSHIFVTRKWERDKKELKEKLFYFNGLNYPLALLLFPEGGDLTHKSKARSDEHADKNGLPRYEYCLHPRTTGLLYTMNAMRSGGLDAVYDITIAYPDAITKTEVEFTKGVIPREIHFYIRDYDAKDVPTDDEELAQWCRDRWREKEERLRDFYKHREFLEHVPTESTGSSEMANGNVVYRKPQELVKPKEFHELFVGLALFIGSHLFFVFLFMMTWYTYVYMIAGATIVFYVSYFRGGVDYFVTSFKREITEQAFARCKNLHSRTANTSEY